MAKEKNYNVLTTENSVPIKAWTKGVQFEDQARKLLLNVAQLPFVFTFAQKDEWEAKMKREAGQVVPPPLFPLVGKPASLTEGD